MPNVTVKRVQSVNIKVNQRSQEVVSGTSTFTGAGLAQKVNQSLAQSNTALASTTGLIPGKFVGGDF
jgi:hypothetical protein